MIIISWDVGVIHLAYCVLKCLRNKDNDKVRITILDWDEINLIEDDRLQLQCCGKLKVKKGENEKNCGNNAIYSLVTPNSDKLYGFCRTHLVQHANYWSQKDTEKLFRTCKTGHICGYTKTNGDECGKTAKFSQNIFDQKTYYCTTHYKSELTKNIKKYSPQPIKKTIVKNYPTSQLQFTLIQKLDNLAEHFSKLCIEEVIIENQPSLKNPKMKAISDTLFNYFMIRGYVDKIHSLDIKLVRFICPNNKLRVNENNTIEVLGRDKTGKQKYKLTKALGIQYTKQLLNKDPKQLEYLNLFKKKDDICDAYLQGRYYLEFMRDKESSKKSSKKLSKKSSKKLSKKSFGSKTSKKKIELEQKRKSKQSNLQNRKGKKNDNIIVL
jgi:hypothetical protein